MRETETETATARAPAPAAARLLVVGTLALAAALAPSDPRGARAAERPLYYDRAITDADLGGRTLRELAIMRNTIFARAGQPFRKRWLHDYFSAQPWYKSRGVVDPQTLGAVDQKNADSLSRHEIALPRADLERRLQAILDRHKMERKAKWNRDEQIEAVLLARALGRKLDRFADLDFERTPFDAPELLDELVPLAQLEAMSRRDLRLLRNMVYARRGRPFRSPILRDYFGKLDWYKADPAYGDARLKPIDRRNIKLIQSAELEAGGPLNDRQHRQEEEVPEA